MLTIYHGSSEVIQKPEFGKGKMTNDYGCGFYCTENLELAKEWASKSSDKQGIVNEYRINTSEMAILDLTDSKYSILNWLAILLENRTFALTAPISIEAKRYILENFSIDTSKYDIIKGYRADDSYFSFAEDFLNNTISVQQLLKAMKLGGLGIQFVIISKKAFSSLQFIGSEFVDEKYFNSLLNRDLKARNEYKNMKVDFSIDSNEMYVRDIIKEKIVDGDSRL